jgi:N-acetylglucosaminyl-diphospho-decaprenol L-rhamnosyltransferase
MNYDLSIVIASWNARDLLLQCLRTIADTLGNLSAEVIVVDNASTDGTAAAVKEAFSWIKVISISPNRGFAAGNNVGIKASIGRYIILLNSDTIVPPGALASLVEFMERHNDAGVCGPRLVHPNQQIQAFAFGRDPTLRYLLKRGANRLLRNRALHDWHTDQIQCVGWVAGTAMVVRRHAFESAGLLDEMFYAYFEDNDWCLRIRQSGWQVYYNPQVSVVHLGGQSLKKDPAARDAYYRSLDYFYAKHYGALARTLLWVSLAPYRLLMHH